MMDTDKPICPVCEKGNVTSEIRDTEVEHAGITGKIIVHYHKCDHCLIDYADSSDTLRNKAAMHQFQAEAEFDL